ncbi:hypothetical protein HY68_36880 [Streptomyces sp. AcH 505]|uniref:hypothetical protein n=1 Tax=Streptomyces sp. AcH 505 TaxID=352211 RepID=UPI000591F44C|nr:hypothetical protein HY68_36880 [Streptomyces sp. AcH 505]
MGATRPTDSDPTQEQQAELLTESGNAPTVDNEAQLLADMYGQPDANGVYGAPATEGSAS